MGRIGRRLGFATGLLLLAALGAWGATFAVTAGLFRSLDPVAPGICTAVSGFVGPEDIAIDHARHLAYVTSADRFAVMREGGAPAGDIFLLPLDKTDPVPRSLAPLPAENFFPHGLDLWIGADGSRRLFVVNHGADGANHSVEIFEVTALGRLVHAETVRSSLFSDPNDLVATGPRSFYVTNLYGSEGATGRLLETYAMLPRADVVHFDGQRARRVAAGFAMPNGIAADPAGDRLYVAEVIGRRVTAFDREPGSGALFPAWSLDLPMGIDNLTVAPDGALWAAGHPRLLAISRRMRDAAVLSPSEVIRIDPATRDWRTVYLDRGESLSAASVAAVHGDALLIGSVFGSRMLRCSLGPPDGS